MSFKEIYALDAKEREAHAGQWGAFNDFPPGWRKISAKEFAQSTYFKYAPDLVEYRQMHDRSKNVPMVASHLNFFWNGTGFGLVADYWKGTVDYYAFGCDHEYEGDPDFVPQFHCNHGYRCKKCGHRYNVDSGD